ncbi:SOS response-associated peptidase family protein [Salinicola endophyticus]
MNMCGRFAFYSFYLSALAKAVAQPNLFVDAEPRYNVPPGMSITVARRADDEAPMTIEQLWWGYRPAWADAKAPLALDNDRSSPPTALPNHVHTSSSGRQPPQSLGKRRCSMTCVRPRGQ